VGVREKPNRSQFIFLLATVHRGAVRAFPGSAALALHVPPSSAKADESFFYPCFFWLVKCLSNTLFKSGENEAFAISVSLDSLKGICVHAMHMIYLAALLKMLGRGTQLGDAGQAAQVFPNQLSSLKHWGRKGRELQRLRLEAALGEGQPV